MKERLTQRRKDAKKEGGFFLCVFAPLREILICCKPAIVTSESLGRLRELDLACGTVEFGDDVVGVELGAEGEIAVVAEG